MKKIPVSGAKRYLSDKLWGIRAVTDGRWTGGKFVHQFEKEFSEYINMRFLTTVNSGSSANLAATAAGIEYSQANGNTGNMIIVAAANFPTTVAPIFQVPFNVNPRWVDVAKDSFAPDMSHVINVLKNDAVLGAIIAVPLGRTFELGKMAARDFNMGIVSECMAIAADMGKFLLFDTCDAIEFTKSVQEECPDADWSSVITTYSFYPAHHITGGEGGAVATNNSEIHRNVNSFASWGRDCTCNPGQDNKCGKRFSGQFGTLPFGYDHKYVYSRIAWNMKMTDMQAGILISQLRHFDSSIRLSNYMDIYESLYGEETIYNMEMMKPWGMSPFGFVVAIKEKYSQYLREIIKYVEDFGVTTRRYFGGNLLRQPAFLGLDTATNYPNADYLTNCVFWVGCHEALSKKQIRHIGRVLRILNQIYEVTI